MAAKKVDLHKEVKVLIRKAVTARQPHYALQFAQAACQVANALAVLKNVPN